MQDFFINFATSEWRSAKMKAFADACSVDVFACY